MENNKPIQLNEYNARKISFDCAIKLLCTFLEQRRAIKFQSNSIIELFELQNKIYEYGKEKRIW